MTKINNIKGVSTALVRQFFANVEAALKMPSHWASFKRCPELALHPQSDTASAPRQMKHRKAS